MDDITTPRPLTPEESAALSTALKSHLRLHNTSCAFQAEADAEDLLNYALEMVDDGETVSHVIEEMSYMELEICTPDVLDNLRLELAEFLARVHKNEGKRNWRDMLVDNRQATSNNGGGNSFEESLMQSEKHVSVQLSAKDAAVKAQREMAALFGGGGENKPAMSSVQERYQQQLIADRVDNKKETNFISGGVVEEQPEYEGKSIDEMRREELMSIMNDRSLNKSEKAMRMEEVKAKYGMSPTNGSSRSLQAPQAASQAYTVTAWEPTKTKSLSSLEVDRGNNVPSPPKGVDLSAKAAVAKKNQEMANLFGANVVNRGGIGGMSSVQQRYQQQLIADRVDNKKERDYIHGGVVGESNGSAGGGRKSMDEMRREELMITMKDKSLDKKEKAKKMEEIRAKYTAIMPPEPERAPVLDSSSSSHSLGPSYSSRNIDISTRSMGNSKNIDISMRSMGSHSYSDNDEEDDECPLSAKSASEKNRREMQAVFGIVGGAARGAMSSYEQSLAADRVSNKIGKPEPVSVVTDKKTSSLVNGYRGNRRDSAPKAAPAAAPPLTLDQQRRAELQVIMKDKSLTKEERRIKMDEVKKQYAALKAEEESNATPVMEDRHVNIDLSANKYKTTTQPKQEIESMRSLSLSERKNMYSNQSTIVAGREMEEKKAPVVLHKPKANLGLYSKHRTKTVVNVDPTAFALGENGMYGVLRSKKKATSHEYAGRF